MLCRITVRGNFNENSAMQIVSKLPMAKKLSDSIAYFQHEFSDAGLKHRDSTSDLDQVQLNSASSIFVPW